MHNEVESIPPSYVLCKDIVNRAKYADIVPRHKNSHIALSLVWEPSANSGIFVGKMPSNLSLYTAFWLNTFDPF